MRVEFSTVNLLSTSTCHEILSEEDMAKENKFNFTDERLKESRP